MGDKNMYSSETDTVAKAIKDKLGNFNGNHLYAIIDCAADPSIYPMLKNSGVKRACLYKKGVHFPGDAMTEELKANAPFLLEVEPDSSFFTKLMDLGFNKNWFIITCSDKDYDTVYEHCSDNLLAQTEDNTSLLFRWYDARILGVFLSSCTIDEIKSFFGPLLLFCHAHADTKQPEIITPYSDLFG
jgi:Domain of unknown function (DUF4123)